MPISDAELNIIAQGFATALKRDFVGPLTARIEALENRPNGVKYSGVWSRDESYAVDTAVTHQGSLWIARIKSKGVLPGDGVSWQLACKKGANGRDAQ